MQIIKLLLVGILLQTFLYGKVNLGDIQNHLQKSLHTHISGQNKSIVLSLYENTGHQPLWIGEKNSKKRNELIRALKDPLFNYKDKPFDQPSIAKLFLCSITMPLPLIKKQKFMQDLT